MMVGREVSLHVEKGPGDPKGIVLHVDKLQAIDSQGLEVLKGVSFDVRAGEVVGIAGVAGNGQSELIEVITGLHKAKSGTVSMNNQNITNHSPKDVAAQGIATIPEDRHHRGLVLDFSIADNTIFGVHDRPPFAHWIRRVFGAVRSYADKLIKEFDVRPTDQDAMVRNLSGGNQQKVIIAREMAHNPALLIAAQPTRGVDVGAIEFIHKRIIEQRDQGRAVLVISNELDEVMGLSDRILVMYRGEITGEIPAAQATEEELGLYMAGVKRSLQAQGG